MPSKRYRLKLATWIVVREAEDRELMRRLVECGKLLGIEVLDHVIVGNGTGRWFSFRDVGEI
jgi:DNA repair protein RadC